MASQIFDCISNSNDNYKTTVIGTSFYFKFGQFDSIIYQSIINYINNIYSIASSHFEDKDDQLKNYALNIKKKYDYVQEHLKDYQHYFTNYFNKNLGQMLVSNKNTLDNLEEKMSNTEYDYKANYIEYYLMVKQTEKYICTYKIAYDKLLNFYTYYGNNASFLCIFDKNVLDFKQNLIDLYNFVITNKISDENSDSDNNKQVLKNAYSSLSQYDNYLNKLNTEILNNGYPLVTIFGAIKNFMFEVKLALKIIATGNIIITSSDTDVDRLNKMAQSMLSYNPDNNPGSFNDNDFILFNQMSIDKIKIAVPIFVEFKKFLKKDWSNFQNIMISSVQAALSNCGLYTNSNIIIDLLPNEN